MEKELKMETDKLAAALAKAQGEMKNAPLNKVNPHFKSKYADLAAIRDATVPTLSKHGLSIAQFTRIAEPGLLLVTRLSHAEGGFIEGEYPLPMMIDQPQKMGSALTYARRYGWSAMCGIAADEDDDANAAQANGNGNGEHITPKPPKDSRSLDWKGPLNKTALQAKCREIVREIESCSDTDQLDVFQDSPDVQAVAAQLRHDMPDWWDRDDSEFQGLFQRFNKRRLELSPLAAE